MLSGPLSSTSAAGRPNDLQCDQPASGAVCWSCHTSRSPCSDRPNANSTSRPSASAAVASRSEAAPSRAPSGAHGSHGPRPGPACRRCYRFRSPVTVNSCRGPSWLRATTGSPANQGPGASSEDQSDQPPSGTVGSFAVLSLLYRTPTRGRHERGQGGSDRSCGHAATHGHHASVTLAGSQPAGPLLQAQVESMPGSAQANCLTE
jgi:hypothetical protein